MGLVAYAPVGPLLMYCEGPAEGYGAGGGYIVMNAGSIERDGGDMVVFSQVPIVK